MKKIEVSDKIREVASPFKVLQIEAKVKNVPTSDELWEEIEKAGEVLKKEFELQALNKRPSIAATRRVYKQLGKDPNRYRPSAEALGRRIINDKGIYRLSSLIDIINLISIKTGYSIGGFDSSKIEGENLVLDSGRSGEEFNAIGRGPLNIEGLPVYRDGKGGIGTPTSDEERTKITEETTELLMLVNIYGEEASPMEVETHTRELLEKYAGLQTFDAKLLEF